MLKAKAKTTDKDLGWKRIIKEVGQIDGSHVDVGYFGNKKEPGSEFTIPQIAAVHEFGGKIKQGRRIGGVPERSFLRTTADAKQALWIADLDRFLTRVLKGLTDVISGMSAFGSMASGDVRRKFDEGDPNWLPLDDSTIKAKGSRKPLIDTGALRNYAGYRVVLWGKSVVEKHG